MSEELEKLRHKQYVAQADRSQAQGEAITERAETADQKRENPSALHPCRNVGDLFERADRPDRRGCDGAVDLHLPERSGSKEAESAD